jgi:hypothetical protein
MDRWAPSLNPEIKLIEAVRAVFRVKNEKRKIENAVKNFRNLLRPLAESHPVVDVDGKILGNAILLIKAERNAKKRKAIAR